MSCVDDVTWDFDRISESDRSAGWYGASPTNPFGHRVSVQAGVPSHHCDDCSPSKMDHFNEGYEFGRKDGLAAFGLLERESELQVLDADADR